MNAERLLAHYERIVDAGDAIPRLREFVLDLAVRGKLVPQDPNEEPASELLERIAVEKARLAKVGKIKSPDTRATIRNDELPIELPNKWGALRLRDIGRLAGGMTPSMSRAEFWGGNTVWLSPKDIKADEVTDSELKITDKGLCETRLELYRPGCLFIVARSGILKRTFPVSINRVPAAANQDMKVLVPFVEGQERYLQVMFRGLTNFILRNLVKTGTTVQSLKYAEFEQQAFPVPPLAEQRRIVSKVDELMALCDRLEMARADREVTRDRFTAASLGRLNSPDIDTFRNDARLALDALPVLTARADQIKQLRQTFLSFAVRGRLVEQDPSDRRENQTKLRSDSAAEEYDRVAFEERAELFVLPLNWKIEPLSRVSEHIVDCPHTTPEWAGAGVLCIKTNQVRAGALDLSLPYFVSEDTYQIRIERLEPHCDDILYIREGGVRGVGCRIPPNTRLCLGQRLMLIRANESVVPAFLELCINSPWITNFAEDRTTGGAAPRVNMSVVRAYPIPIPPLAEQHRIIAKVDELVSLCDRLEATLTSADETRRRLLEVLLAEALVPSDARELEAAE